MGFQLHSISKFNLDYFTMETKFHLTLYIQKVSITWTAKVWKIEYYMTFSYEEQGIETSKKNANESSDSLYVTLYTYA